ncbi:glycogen synthase GlgA [Rhodocista pekingensis]|uniref:Glycogen synthase n=1 Tax=Rhodocista pekingensis TaxID=201185 RepID=A0ABW2KUF6_9PROT
MRVLFVASECFPYVKTGGLADVVAALPAALRELGIDARLLLPGYPPVLKALGEARPLRDLPPLPGAGGQGGRLLAGTAPAGGTGSADGSRAPGALDPAVPLYALDLPVFFDRAGNPYSGPDGQDWPDNALRFASLSAAAARIGLEGDGEGWRPEIIHAHDWQTGLVPAYLRFAAERAGADRMVAKRPVSVFTIHNLAFQGLVPPARLGDLDLPPHSFSIHGLEFHGKIGLLKAGLYYADKLTTVSPTYAQEIQGTAMGFGLDGLLRARARDLSGILNGVDLRLWDPASDPLIPARYDATLLEARQAAKAELRHAFGLGTLPDGPLFAVVSRLTHQKGIDLVLEALPRLLALGGQLAILGTGDKALEQAAAAAMHDHPGRVGLVRAYDEALAHRIQAGADVLLVPSRFEPCGLTQMYALRYGALPLVSRVGGLADTVTDVTEGSLADGSATGFVFEPVALTPLIHAMERAVALWRRPDLWRTVQHNAMGRDVGWAASARHYADLYRQAVMDTALSLK